MIEPKLSLNKDKISSFCKKYHIISLALFGSILTSKFGPHSDVDILVKFDKQHTPNFFQLFDIQEELSSIVGRQVDLRTPNDLSPLFRDEVLLSATTIYG